MPTPHVTSVGPLVGGRRRGTVLTIKGYAFGGTKISNGGRGDEDEDGAYHANFYCHLHRRQAAATAARVIPAIQISKEELQCVVGPDSTSTDEMGTGPISLEITYSYSNTIGAASDRYSYSGVDDGGLNKIDSSWTFDYADDYLVTDIVPNFGEVTGGTTITLIGEVLYLQLIR